MKKVTVYDAKGDKLKDVTLDPTVFAVSDNPTVLRQVIEGYRANARQTSAATKDRSAVRGGGKKPWRQKGTGRARAGSTRSPLWRGGGITFGPQKERNWNVRLPKKLRQKALAITLSEHAQNGTLALLRSIKLTKPSTKTAIQILAKIAAEPGTLLYVSAALNPVMFLSLRNIPGVEIKPANELNAYDAAKFKHLVLEEDAVPTLVERIKG